MAQEMTQKSNTDPLAEVRAIYQALEQRPVQRQCIARTECCQFQLTGLTPHLTRGEALLAARAFRATGRRELPPADDGVCPLLQRTTGRCLIYADRPFGCRTHFCAAAGGPYARKEVLDLIRRLEDLDVRLNGDGPRKIVAALADALANPAGKR
jgi:Fe-S-cluster containining protein